MGDKLYPVGGKSITITVTPTLSVAASYVANDYIGTSDTPMTFAAAALTAGGSGLIVSAILVDYALQSVAGELWLFDTTITTPSDSAAWSITDAMAKTCVGVIPFSTYYASALNSISHGDLLPRAFKCASGSTSLFGAFVTRGAPSYSTGDLTFRLTIMYD